jgi:hypothetical protein
MVGAGERSPSAPRRESIVYEREGEAPRVKAGEPHSPVPLPSGGDFASREDLFASHSLFFEPHSPAFEPSEGEGKRRELLFEWREDLFVSHSPAFEPPDRLFASHSPKLERREEDGTRREEEGMPREEWGMRHFKLFARRSPHIAYNSLRGMSLDLFFTGLEERGMPQKMQGTSRKSIVTPLPAP